MPPRKRAKSNLEAELEQFVERGAGLFRKLQARGTLTVAAYEHILQELDLQYDDTLVSAQDREQGIELDRLKGLLKQAKRESDMHEMAQYVYKTLSYGEETLTLENLFKALKTLPRQPKALKTVAEMVSVANGTGDYRQPVSFNVFRLFIREHTAFFEKNYTQTNLDISRRQPQ